MSLEYFLTQVKAYAETQDLLCLDRKWFGNLYQKDKKNVLRNAIKKKSWIRKIFIILPAVI